MKNWNMAEEQKHVPTFNRNFTSTSHQSRLPAGISFKLCYQRTMCAVTGRENLVNFDERVVFFVGEIK